MPLTIASPGSMLLLLESLDMKVTELIELSSKTICEKKKRKLAHQQIEAEKLANGIFEAYQNANHE